MSREETVSFDFPYMHWSWMLEEACYRVERGVQPMASVDIPEAKIDNVIAIANERGLVAYAPEDQRGPVITFESNEGIVEGERIAVVYVAQSDWIIGLLKEMHSLSPQSVHALTGLLYGYSIQAIGDFLNAILVHDVDEAKEYLGESE